jgi:hypothetical protein
MASTRIVTAIADQISARSRAAKWQQFLEWASPSPEATVLDVGVNTTEYSPSDNYLERHYPYPHKVTAVGLEDDFSGFNARYPAVKTLTGDGTKLPFGNNEFAISYSNAVVEHVGGFDEQVEFVREMHRVGRRGFLTTPNRQFPVEIHTRVPLLHLMLRKQQFDWFLHRIGKAWAAGDYMTLLDERTLKCVLRTAGVREFQLRKNRLAGLTMSFTVTWTK